MSQSAEWDATVRSFAEHDLYYLSGYVKAFHIHGDGDPYLLYYEDNGVRAIYVYMRRKTALEGVFDSVTPYGYGGVLFEGDTSEANLQAFWAAYLEKMAEELHTIPYEIICLISGRVTRTYIWHGKNLTEENARIIKSEVNSL